jgi:hypothetical protein
MTENMKNPALTVFRGFPVTNAHAWSPFSTKLEARLRFNSVPYRLGSGSPPSAPKKKIPYIEVDSGEDGGQKQSMGDTSLIIRHLIAEGQLNDLNEKLTPPQRAHDLAIRSMMEDKLYFYGVREKWFDNYEVIRDRSLAAIPWLIRIVVGFFIRRTVGQALHGQGAGRFTDDEVDVFNEEIWENVNALLLEAKKAATTEDPFWALGGVEPTEADATLYGFIAGTLVCEA